MYALMVSPLNVKNVANFGMRISPILGGHAALPAILAQSPAAVPATAGVRPVPIAILDAPHVRRARPVARLQRQPGHGVRRFAGLAVRRAVDPRARAQHASE